MQLHQRGRPPCLAAQDGAGVCTACTRTRVYSLTRRLHRASHIASTTLHRPCTDLAPTLRRPCTDLAPTLRRPCRMLAARLPHAPRALAGYLPCISPISAELSQARRTALGAMLDERADEASAVLACAAALSPRTSSARPAPARPAPAMAPALAAPYGVRAAPRRGPPPAQAAAAARAEKPSPRLTGWEAAPAEAPSALAVLEQPGRSQPGSVLAGGHLVAVSGSRHSVGLNFVH